MSEISDILHEQNLKAEKNALSSHDKHNIKTSLSPGQAYVYLGDQDKNMDKKGIDLYKQGKLTPEIGKKLDHKIKVNGYTEDFLESVQDNVDEPTLGDGYDDPDDNAHYNHNRISKHTLDNGSFQKDALKNIKSYLGPHETLAQDLDLQSFSASNIFHILDKTSAKGFSSNVRKYFKDKRSNPKQINSLAELAKIKRPSFKKNPQRMKDNGLKTKPLNKKHLSKAHKQSRHVDRGQGIE